MADYIKGVDLSAVVEVEELGAKYYDNGVQGDIFDILKNYGVNSVRLRLWNDPYTEDGVPYGEAWMRISLSRLCTTTQGRLF